MDVRTNVPNLYGEHLQKFGDLWKTQVESLRARWGSKIERVDFPGEALTDVPVVWVLRSEIVEVLRFLKSDPGFEYNFLADITATDEMPERPRFVVVYQLFSHTRFNRIRLKVKVEDGESVPTAVDVWPGANWAEREIWDMFGIKFDGHPDLRRILMDERWEGHPLRKDYPLRGYQIFPTPQVPNEDLLK